MNLVSEGSKKQKQMFVDHPAPMTLVAKNTHKNIALVKAIDSINQRQGKDTLFWLSSGIKPRHTVKQNQRSPRFTTRWEELAFVF